MATYKMLHRSADNVMMRQRLKTGIGNHGPASVRNTSNLEDVPYEITVGRRRDPGRKWCLQGTPPQWHRALSQTDCTSKATRLQFGTRYTSSTSPSNPHWVSDLIPPCEPTRTKSDRGTGLARDQSETQAVFLFRWPASVRNRLKLKDVPTEITHRSRRDPT